MDDDENLDTPPTPPVATPPAVTPPPAPPVAAVPLVPPLAPAPVERPSSDDSQRRALLDDHKARAERKLLKRLFGTDDMVEVERIRSEQSQRLEQHQQMVSAEEQRKREQMSEVDRLNADVTRLTNENTELKAQLQRLKGDKVAAEQDAKIRSLAVAHIQPKWLKYAMNEFRDYVMSLSPEDQKKLDERRTTRWFAELAKREQVISLEQSTPAATPPAAPPATPPAPPASTTPAVPPLQRRPLLPAGARPAGAPPKPNAAPPVDPLAGKTPLPGKPNSMNRQELRDYAKREGLPYPG